MSRRLEQVLQDYWGSFAARGVPRRPKGTIQPISGGAVPEWPVYKAPSNVSGTLPDQPRKLCIVPLTCIRMRAMATEGAYEYMVLAPEVSIQAGYYVTTPCAFWDNFSVAVKEHLCYETNPTPRRTAGLVTKEKVLAEENPNLIVISAD